MPVGTIPADNFIKAKTVHIVKLLGKLRITGGVYFVWKSFRYRAYRGVHGLGLTTALYISNPRITRAIF